MTRNPLQKLKDAIFSLGGRSNDVGMPRYSISEIASLKRQADERLRLGQALQDKKGARRINPRAAALQAEAAKAR